ncbi:MAG: crossover junction endodeoxyribonuclease RuvC [Lentisphaeraceae bacterium]|nr:crossover junction endodeoxyribonuclease RuvC [Lentisphaeraceae bacterium]
MIFLGIDTSLRSTGYGVIKISGNSVSALDCGVIKNKASLTQLECLHRISGGITQLIKLYKPNEIVIEGAFVHKYPKTALILGMARGAALAAAAAFELPTYEYAPKKAKLAVTGNGNASKEQVAFMMAQILKVDIKNINDDATDALALCICHYNAAKLGMTEKNRL